MSRKSIILSLVALALMLLGIGVAVLLLYSDVDHQAGAKNTHVTEDDRHVLLSAIPSDAVLVSWFSDARKSAPDMIPSLEMPESMKKSPMAVSLHYSGKLIPLYVFETPKDEAVASALAESLSSGGMTVDRTVPSLIVASASETLVKSSMRHLDRKVSVLDASGFDKALASVSGNNVAIISNAHIGRLLPAVMGQAHTRHSSFLTRLCDWTAFDITSSSSGLSLRGSVVYDEDASDFMTVLQKSDASTSTVFSVLPSYTLFALSLPMKSTEPYVTAYQSYLDSRQRLQTNVAARNAFKKEYGIAPEELMSVLDVREVAAARIMQGGIMEKISLIKVGDRNASLVDTIDYAAVVPLLFGDVFACGKDAQSIMTEGWIISGNPSVLEEYKSGEALKNTLESMLDKSGQSDLAAPRGAVLTSWFSFTAEPSFMSELFSRDFLSKFRKVYEGADSAPAVLHIYNGKDGMVLDFNLKKMTVRNEEAEKFSRDTVVTVPSGPFMVKNSGTGRMNEFSQDPATLSLTLRENGKELWTVPFSGHICGTAQTIDYFTNGKLQILFGSGSRLWLMDRLGRNVDSFRLDLGKDILLGPDVYDFSGNRRYNIMVLHKDNTIAMYNLKGAKPASWKDITVSEGIIKALPERIDLGGSTFWVVRTSVETLIFPLYGGSPLTTYAGSQRIRPDSQVKAVDGTTVEFTCYDGKVRTQALK